MSSDLLIVRAANLFAGTDPDASNHLALADIRLPAIERAYVDHVPGGARVAIEVATHIERLEAGFNLLGWQPHVLRLIGRPQRFTIYAALEQLRDGQILEAKALIEGEIGRAVPETVTRGPHQATEYAIRGIMHYDLMLAGETLFQWDFWAIRSQQVSTNPSGLLRTLLPGVLEV